MTRGAKRRCGSANMAFKDAVASDEVLNLAYQWLCERQKD